MLLSYQEILLIKGLLRHGLLNQQQVIASFSFPARTIHHNTVSEIARGLRYGSDTLHPPADEDECRRFILNWPSNWKLPSGRINLGSSSVFEFSYSYHPVGQGLFCSGVIARSHGDPFRWVFDCGTERGRRDAKQGDHVRREIAVLAQEQRPTAEDRPHLDLVCLSHFDEDHLSGLLDLLATFSVDTLLLPYLAPWSRLLIALTEGAAAGSAFLDFLLAPTEFLLGIEGVEIGRILLVPPSGEGPALPPLLPPGELGPVEGPDRFPEIELKGTPPEAEDEDDAAGADGGLSNSKVKMLSRGAAITVGRAWEFVPYNDASLAVLADKNFTSAARGLARQLVMASSDSARDAALNELTELYAVRFKTPRSTRISAERRNKISLFLYSGPIGNVELIDIEEANLRHGLSPASLPVPVEWLWTGRFGQMFTGDGYLKTRSQWANFEAFFRPHGRLGRGAIFQVMHHGSKANWQKGLASRLQPLASVFCSDPAGHLKHPSLAVRIDFSSYNPKQVDAFHGWSINGRYKLI